MWCWFTRRLLFHIPRGPADGPAQRVASHTRTRLHSYHHHHERSSTQGGVSDTPTRGTSHAFSQRRGPSRHSRRASPGRALKPGEPLPPPSPPPSQAYDRTHRENSHGYTSQREAYRQQQADTASSSVEANVPGSYFTPFPRNYGFYGGIDADALESPQASREERREQLRSSLEAQAATVVEFSEGGEADMDLNGLPPEQYNGHAGWTTIPKNSALFQSLYSDKGLESRQRTNSWSVAMRHDRASAVVKGGGGVSDLMGESSAPPSPASPTQEATPDGNNGDETGEKLDDKRRRRQHDESLYSTALEGELLAPTPESVGQPRSTYALRKMYVDGLVGYQGMVTRAEEALMSEELLHLLQDRRAAYIAEEARYCVNLYEKELGIPGKDTLAFALSSCPTLQKVLYRFFFLGLIPALPNVCQVSEMVGTFSGYPVHRHPPSIGSYVGLLNLISTSVLHLQHKDAPWYPRLHLTPRSLFVLTEPCLSEYAVGYKQTHQPFHAFEYATRVSKDYRIEVLFATVESAQTQTLSQAVQLTEYAEKKTREMPTGGTGQQALLTDSASRPSQSTDGTSEAFLSPLHGHTDAWLERLRSTLHASEEATSRAGGGGRDGEGRRTKPLDGQALRQQLLQRHLVGTPKRDGDEEQREEAQTGDSGHSSNAPPSMIASTKPPSAAQRRLSALKARYDFAQRLKASQEQVAVSSSGPRLIRGHSPKDRRMGIK